MTEKFVFIGCFFVGVLLFGVMNQKGGGRFNFLTPFDKYIPFIPALSVPYLLLFPCIAFAGIVLFNTEYAVSYYASMALAMCSAAVVWFFFPSKMARPRVEGKNMFEKIVAKIYNGDSHANAFPSSHVFTSLITSYYLALVFPVFGIPIWFFGVTIAVSTVLIKQHFAVDVLAGIAWTYACISLAHMYFG
ncbi:phosphatase PAP2 family protein [Patescibacteria group bacterium]|nr:phosphatase PAP2 family protein [Patescibacteria group bacterium]